MRATDDLVEFPCNTYPHPQMQSMNDPLTRCNVSWKCLISGRPNFLVTSLNDPSSMEYVFEGTQGDMIPPSPASSQAPVISIAWQVGRPTNDAAKGNRLFFPSLSSFTKSMVPPIQDYNFKLVDVDTAACGAMRGSR